MREGNGSRMASRYVALLTGRRVLPVPEIEKIKGGLGKTKCFEHFVLERHILEEM